MLLDPDPSQITPIAEAVFRLVGVKAEFLPEIAPPPYYGWRGGYEKKLRSDSTRKHVLIGVSRTAICRTNSPPAHEPDRRN